MSLAIFQRLAEEKIKKAQQEGALDDLPGRGDPLPLEDDSGVPDELRMAYKILKNAGYVPPEIQAKKEICQIEELLAKCPDEKARYQAIKRLNYLTMKLGCLRPDSSLLSENSYTGKIVQRLVKDDKK